MFFDSDLSSFFIMALGSKGAGDGDWSTGVVSRMLPFGVGGRGSGSLWAPSEDRELAHEPFPDPPEMYRAFRRKLCETILWGPWGTVHCDAMFNVGIIDW